MDSENREREELRNRYSFLKDAINEKVIIFHEYIYKKINPNAPGDDIVYTEDSMFNLRGHLGFQRYAKTGFRHTAFDFDTLIDEYIKDKNESTKMDNSGMFEEFIKYLLRTIWCASDEQLAYNVTLLLLNHDNDKETTKHDICITLDYINIYWYLYNELFNINSNKEFYDKCYEKMIKYNYVAQIYIFDTLYERDIFAYMQIYKTKREQDKIKQIYLNYISQQLKKIDETPEHLTIERNGQIKDVQFESEYYNLINCQLLEDKEKNNFMFVCLNNLDSHIETKRAVTYLAKEIIWRYETREVYKPPFIFNQDVYKKCVNICSHKEEYLKMHQQWLQSKALAQANQNWQQEQEKTQQQVQK